MSLTKTQQLQQIWDDNKTSDQYDWEIKWRGRAGWWAIPFEARWFLDEGEFLGYNFKSAKATLSFLLR